MRRLTFVALVLSAVVIAAQAAEVTIHAVSAAKAPPLDPFDPAWQAVPAAQIPLMPQVLLLPRGGGSVKAVKVQALYTTRTLYIRLEWDDARPNTLPSAAESFPDACAIQLPAKLGTWPSPLMGDAANPVVIWRWSGAAQKDIEEGWQGVAAAHPRLRADVYAFADDPLYRSAEGAGNVLAQRDRQTPVESLVAKGYGSLSVQKEQSVQGKGVWQEERWGVVMARPLKGTPRFEKGLLLPMAVAVWDGGSGERNGQKSFSVWHSLALDPVPQVSIEQTPVARGHRVFHRHGCMTCHGSGGRGGVKNPNLQGGLIPPINKVKEGFTEEEVKQVVRQGRSSVREDPRGPTPPLQMNAWGQVMDEQELDDLVKYLWGLAPKTEAW